jgi:hypothetical protein
MNSEAAEDLERLGGPIAEEGAAPEPAPEESSHISFADLAMPEEPAAVPAPVEDSSTAHTASAPAIDMPTIPRTLERPAVKFPFQTPEPVSLVEPVEPAPTAPAPMMDLEPAAFEPPPPEAVPAQAADIKPFDEGLAWGAGERVSSAVRPEDVAEAEAHHEPVAPAIEFMGADPNMATAPMESVAPPPDWAMDRPGETGKTGETVKTVEMVVRD